MLSLFKYLRSKKSMSHIESNILVETYAACDIIAVDYKACFLFPNAPRVQKHLQTITIKLVSHLSQISPKGNNKQSCMHTNKHTPCLNMPYTIS